ncbi:hypothetical protein RA241_003671 [Cronobacter sakazakii]|nr:hypothetical protein [Cronobacter sakazakii]
MNQQKKWVFTELVKDPNNIEQLISYAIYKGFKDEKAQILRKENKSDAEIDKELAKYHDHCLNSRKQLDVFRGKAKEIVEGYVAAANSGILERANAEIAKFEADKKKEILALEKKVKEAEKAALKLLMQGAEKYSKQVKKPVGFWEHTKVIALAIVKFMFSGVPKLIATACSIGLIFFLYSLVNEDARTGLRQGLYSMVDAFVPEKKVNNKQNNISSVSPNKQDVTTD